jgi:hypothetical protein
MLKFSEREFSRHLNSQGWDNLFKSLLYSANIRQLLVVVSIREYDQGGASEEHHHFNRARMFIGRERRVVIGVSLKRERRRRPMEKGW